MWDFNWGLFWALVAYGALKFGVKRVLGLFGARGATEELPAARSRLNPRHEAARTRKKELVLRDTRTRLVVLAAAPEPGTSSRTHERLRSDDVTNLRSLSQSNWRD